MKRIFVLATEEGDAIRALIAEGKDEHECFDKAWNETIRLNEGELLIDVTDIVKEIFNLYNEIEGE